MPWLQIVNLFEITIKMRNSETNFESTITTIPLIIFSVRISQSIATNVQLIKPCMQLFCFNIIWAKVLVISFILKTNFLKFYMKFLTLNFYFFSDLFSSIKALKRFMSSSALAALLNTFALASNCKFF